MQKVIWGFQMNTIDDDKRGFTLIELLVVIAIIAMLLAIITPALKKAKECAIAMICMGNQRQAALATVTYGMDNDGSNIPSWAQTTTFTGVPEHWYTFIRPYYGDAINMAFLDGHAEYRVDVDDLLKFRWHKKWDKSLITP